MSGQSGFVYDVALLHLQQLMNKYTKKTRKPQFKLRAVMTDCEAAMRKSIHKFYPDALQMLCWFHIKQAVTHFLQTRTKSDVAVTIRSLTNLGDADGNGDVATAVSAIFERLYHCKTEKIYDSTLTKVLPELLRLGGKDFVTYLKKMWLKARSQLPPRCWASWGKGDNEVWLRCTSWRLPARQGKLLNFLCRPNEQPR